MRPQESVVHAFEAIALPMGFSAVGGAPVEPLDEEFERLRRWLADGMHAGMDWMARHAEMRRDVRALLPSAQSVIVFVHPYPPKSAQPADCTYKVAKYAQIKDYHKTLKKKLRQVVRRAQEALGPFEYRLCVDSAPIMEKVWAVRAGLGWIGKNGNLLRPREGSFFFLAEVITNLPVPQAAPMPDMCGRCTRCIEACPTRAIVRDRVVDARRCIAYHTIERRGPFTADDTPAWDEWIFGCDVCQDVCPWNVRFARPPADPRFQPTEAVRTFRDADWEGLTPEQFDRAFAGMPIRRAKYEGIMRNIEWVKRTRGKG